MPRPRLTACACVGACALSLTTGCITLYSKTEVVRGGETRRPVKFECRKAADEFQTSVSKHSRQLGGTYVGVPFVTLFHKDQHLSEAAVWNDAVEKCDTDQDGTITCDESAVFAKMTPQ